MFRLALTASSILGPAGDGSRCDEAGLSRSAEDGVLNELLRLVVSVPSPDFATDKDPGRECCEALAAFESSAMDLLDSTFAPDPSCGWVSILETSVFVPACEIVSLVGAVCLLEESSADDDSVL